jgi:hypothetical protein
VRFHSLPDSERYPNSESDYLTILDRQNAVLHRLAEVDPNVILLTTEFSFFPTPSNTPAESPDATWWRTVAVDEERFWHIYAKAIIWQPGHLDFVFRKAADDQIGNLMICQADCRWLHHAYDGGMDVILETASKRDALRKSFFSWLSPHPSGL